MERYRRELTVSAEEMARLLEEAKQLRHDLEGLLTHRRRRDTWEAQSNWDWQARRTDW